MKVVYSVFIAEHEGSYLVCVPNLEVFIEGKDMADAMEMARDAISLHCISLEDEGIEFPKNSPMDEAREKEKKYAGIFDYTQGVFTYIDVDITAYRKRMEQQC